MPLSRRSRRLALSLILGLAPGAGWTHPHVFIDGGVDFVFDPQGRLESLRVTWIYDPLTSLFMFEELAIGGAPHAPLPPEDRARLAAYQTEWMQGFDGDSYLWHRRARIGLSGPVSPDAEVTDGGRVTISFLRRLETPLRPDASTVVKIYDPSYFTAYLVTDPPDLRNAPDGCSAKVVPFAPSGPLIALQQELRAVPIDADPAEDLGALFAEQVFVSCE